MEDRSHHRMNSNSKDYISQSVRRNAMIFAVLMVLLQIGFSLIYGFLITIPAITFNSSSILVTIGLAILIVAGFGLLFGYTRKLSWSGIGFTFFITAFCLEVYPLVNAFWTKAGLQANNAHTNFSWSNRQTNLYLSDRETGTGEGITFYGNSLTNALKCALGIAAAFSSILGRAGHLECLLVTSFGIVGFQLNRQLIQQYQGTDAFGTYFIFTFGGFMGLGLGLWELIRERKVTNQLDNTSLSKYVGSQPTVLYATFGALIIFALFPLLAYEFDGYSNYSSHNPTTSPVCLLLGMGAGTIGALSLSCLINGSIIARDLLHGPVAGAIAVGASSLFIANPMYALVAGAAGGIIQTLLQNIVERHFINSKVIVSTVSWSLFGIQGIIGAGFAAGWKAILFTNNSGLTIEPKVLQFTSQFEFYGGLISAGIGLAFGLGVGLLILLVNNQISREYFEDFFYWYSSDGIRYENLKTQVRLPSARKSQQPIRQHEPKIEKPEQPQVNTVTPPIQTPLSEYQPEFDFSEDTENIINPYSYL